MRISWLLWCACVQIGAQSFDLGPPSEGGRRPSFPVSVELSRGVPGLKLLVTSPVERKVVAQAELSGVRWCEIQDVPEGQFELLLTTLSGQVLLKQSVSVPTPVTIQMQLPEVDVHGAPVCWHRLTHKVPRKSEKEAGRALAAEHAGRTEEAEAAWQRALVADPKNLDALEHLGELKLKAQDWAQASELLDRALALDPADWRSLLNAGLAHYGEDDFAAALKHARQGLRWAPDQARLHYLAGLAILRLGNSSEEARAHLEQAGRQIEAAKSMALRLTH